MTDSLKGCLDNYLGALDLFLTMSQLKKNAGEIKFFRNFVSILKILFLQNVKKKYFKKIYVEIVLYFWLKVSEKCWILNFLKDFEGVFLTLINFTQVLKHKIGLNYCLKLSKI